MEIMESMLDSEETRVHNQPSQNPIQDSDLKEQHRLKDLNIQATREMYEKDRLALDEMFSLEIEIEMSGLNTDHLSTWHQLELDQLQKQCDFEVNMIEQMYEINIQN